MSHMLEVLDMTWHSTWHWMLCFGCFVFLVIFCQDNFGAPTTRVRRLEFFGQPASSMDMKDVCVEKCTEK